MMVWLLIGFLAGLVNIFSIVRDVARLNPATRHRALRITTSGFLFRLALSAVVLTLALRSSAASGLLAFLGLWLARWVAVYLPRSKGRVGSAPSDIGVSP